MRSASGSLHYQSARESLNFRGGGELKKKRRRGTGRGGVARRRRKGKEAREDKRGAACCISIPPAERLSVCLWQQPREGDTLCILTQLVYLSLSLSLSISRSVCLSLRLPLCGSPSDTFLAPSPPPLRDQSEKLFFIFSPRSLKVSD